MSTVVLSAVAIDIGSTMYIATVNPDVDDRPVRAFSMFTGDLHDTTGWFCHRRTRR